MKFTLPLRTYSRTNVREHWSRRHRRSKIERRTAHLAALAADEQLPELPCIITLTRVAPRLLDDDNLRGALKSVRDGLSDAYCVDDRDPRIRWEYGQRRGAAKEYGVDVSINNQW